MNTNIYKYRMLNLRGIRWRHARNLKSVRWRRKVGHKKVVNSICNTVLSINGKNRRNMNRS